MTNAAITTPNRPARPTGGRPGTYVAITALAGCLLWSYWPVLAELAQFWWRNDDYSVGALVLPVALFLAWGRREQLARLYSGPALLGGLGLILFGEATRLAGVHYGSATGERYGFIFSVAGVVLMAGGWRIFWNLRWVLVFLFLMVPFPARAHELIAGSLQRVATNMAVFMLELLGFFVIQEGNVIRLGDQALVHVTEACSGLRMLTAFIFVSAVVAFIIERPVWQRITLLAMSVPIALLSNALRGALTAIFVYYSDSRELNEHFHDMAGLAMMPLALVLVFAILQLMHLITKPEPPRAELGAGRVGAPAAAGKGAAS